jgi:predicted HTH domain antitoxin
MLYFVQEFDRSLILEIPDSVVCALRLPRKEQSRQLKKELAVSLYAQGILSFGKACELAEIDQLEFGILLGNRSIPRQYDEQDLNDDITYAGGE